MIDARAGASRRRRRTLDAVMLLLLLLPACGAPGSATAAEPQAAAPLPVVHFEQAQALVVAWHEGDAPPPATAPWQPVALPDVVQRPLTVSLAGDIPERIAWYRVRWTPGATAAPATVRIEPDRDPLALYVPRVIAHPLQVWIDIGGRWFRVLENVGDAGAQWNRPLLLNLPGDATLPVSGLTVAVGLPYDEGAYHALASLWIGPRSALERRHARRQVLQHTLPEVASLTMAALGLLSFGIWLRRRGERAYLYFALASFLWPLRNLHYFIDYPTDPLALAVFWWLSSASLSWVMLAIYLFAFRFDTRRYPGLERGFLVFVVAGTIASVPVWRYDALLLQHLVNMLAGLFVTGVMTRLALAGGSRELRVIVLALWASLAFGVHDWALLALRITPESVYLLPYASMLIIASFVYAAQRRFVQAVEQVEAANDHLALKLAEREAELETYHAQLRRAERDQAVLLERQRLMREMHDGVGSTLISTLRVFEHGGMSNERAVEVLRGTVDDLRVALDSLEPIDQDLTTLLAALRSRMGRRLEGAGLQLRWSMQDLPLLPWLDAPQALQILRLLQESLANVINHARARTVSISAAALGDAVVVEVRDDGVGFDAAADAGRGGRGLANMAQRARLLGGTLAVVSHPGQGTTVRLTLPKG